MKIYIAGKITGLANYRELFNAAEEMLRSYGYEVMNPAVLPTEGFEHHEYLHINKAMIDVCDAVYFLYNWVDSKGAIIEHNYAREKKKLILPGIDGPYWLRIIKYAPKVKTAKKGLDVLMDCIVISDCPQSFGLNGRCNQDKISSEDCRVCWESALAEEFYD